MHKELIEKPIIIAICGKSATGKDTLAKFLTNYFSSLGFYTNNVVSVTTRPPRVNEKNGIDYYFVTDEQFNRLIETKKLVEFTHFRSWQYGVPFESIKSGYINIGVFNPEGLRSLQYNKYKYTIIPVYLKERFWIRMRRSYERVGHWEIEFIRRAIADYFDFRKLEKRINLSNGRWIHLKQINGVWRQSNIIKTTMIYWHILIQDKETGELRLGNFI